MKNLKEIILQGHADSVSSSRVENKGDSNLFDNNGVIKKKDLSGKSVCLKEVTGDPKTYFVNRSEEGVNFYDNSPSREIITLDKESVERIKVRLARITMFFSEERLEDQNITVSPKGDRKVFFATEYVTKEQKEFLTKKLNKLLKKIDNNFGVILTNLSN